MVEQADNHTGFGRSLLVEIEDLSSERVAYGQEKKNGKKTAKKWVYDDPYLCSGHSNNT
jgi:hypothetical protein